MNKVRTLASFFAVLAFAACSSPSGVDLASTQITAPNGLTATPSGTDIALTWTAGAGIYQDIYRSTKDGNYSLVWTTVSTSYTDTGLDSSKTYWYMVLCRDGAGGISAGVKAVMTLAGFPAPAGLSLNANTSNVSATWSTVYGATTYQLERSTDNLNWTTVANTSGTYYNDSGLNFSTLYYYRVMAGNGSTNGAYKNASATTGVDMVGLYIQSYAATYAVLNWSFNSYMSTWMLYRSDDGGSTYNSIASGSYYPYYDYGVTSGNTYYYRMDQYIWNSNYTSQTMYSSGIVSVTIP